jgi:two-component system OmpR family sensor kinase
VQLVAIVGLSTDDYKRTLGRLLGLELAIGGAAVALALVATSWGVQFSLRRLRRVTATAQEVAAELSPDGAGLDRRVEVTEPDTEVGQLADSMNTLLAAVETQFAARLANEQQMRQFLADASHELRTPLTSIRGYAELARMQRAQGQLIDPTENLARIESEGTRMSRLVDDLLTLARTDQGSAPRNEWIDVAELLEEAVGGVRAAHPTRRIDLTAPPALNIIGDRDQLLRVVRNLVTNAAVHTRQDGPIVVAAARESGSLVIRISDAGPGLPPEEAAHVFERFWRADKARTRARGGSGLGLAIVASIVQVHGGTVAFDSTVEGGSTVTVHLPLGTG